MPAETRASTKRKERISKGGGGSNDDSVAKISTLKSSPPPSTLNKRRREQKQRPRKENFTKRQNIAPDGIYPMNKFPYHLNYKMLDLRKHPQLYRWGIGEQGVLMVEPYKSELLPLWKFKNPDIATKSSQELCNQFYEYIKQEDFVGADMARKFIQMGFTRSRRYANHTGGRKYSYKDGIKGKELPKAKMEDRDKAESAEIFKAVLEQVKKDPAYASLRTKFEQKYKDVKIGAEEEEEARE